jgi:biopolymer transport protein ExbB
LLAPQPQKHGGFKDTYGVEKATFVNLPISNLFFSSHLAVSSLLAPPSLTRTWVPTSRNKTGPIGAHIGSHPTKRTINVFDFNGIIIKGGPVMVPLLACSIISLAVVIERMIFWRKARSRAPVEELLQLVELAKLGEFAKAMELGRKLDLPAARVLTAGLAHRNPSLAKALEVTAQAEIPVLKRRLTILDTIITLAPLLGLLGTITGMISSFGIMSEAGLGQPHAVTGEAGEQGQACIDEQVSSGEKKQLVWFSLGVACSVNLLPLGEAF